MIILKKIKKSFAWFCVQPNDYELTRKYGHLGFLGSHKESLDFGTNTFRIKLIVFCPRIFAFTDIIPS